VKKILFGFLLFVISFTPFIYAQSDLDKIIDLSSSPINTFKESCSRCHGNEGSAYGKGFAEMSDDSLKEIVFMMMKGPAQLTPGQADIEAMTGYNKSFRTLKPFAIVMNSKSFLEGKDDDLLVNLSAKAKLSIEDKKVKTELTGDNCKLFYDQKKIKELKITVTKDNNSSSFVFPKQLWSE